jgi:hypothetical protein
MNTAYSNTIPETFTFNKPEIFFVTSRIELNDPANTIFIELEPCIDNPKNSNLEKFNKFMSQFDTIITCQNYLVYPVKQNQAVKYKPSKILDEFEDSEFFFMYNIISKSEINLTDFDSNLTYDIADYIATLKRKSKWNSIDFVCKFSIL